MADKLNVRTVRLRSWFGVLTMRAEQLLRMGTAPERLEETTSPDRIRSACRKAGLPRAVDEDVRSLVVALAMALDATAPRPHAQIRKRVGGLRRRAQNLLYSLEEGHLEWDVIQSLWGGFTSEPLRDGTIDIAWEYDAVADLRTALETFIKRAADPHLDAHSGGVRPEPTTIAALALVGFALAHVPNITAAPLARLAEDLFDEVLRLAPSTKEPPRARKANRPTRKPPGGLSRARRGSDAGPDWHDRISQALIEHRRPA